MQIVPLGRGQLHSSRLAYGCWRVARAGNAKADYRTTHAAVMAAVEAGYTLFDHADIYCEGRAEEMFGKVLREEKALREKIVVATKCGIRKAGDPAGAPYRYDFSAEYLEARCEASLKRLGIETIDVFQLHRPDFLMDVEEVAGAFDRLHRAGKVREFGVSNFNAAQCALLQSGFRWPLAVNQIELSLGQLTPFDDGTLDYCQREKLTVLAWSPLGGGLLADGATDILRHQHAYDTLPVVTVLDEIAQTRETTRELIALAWLLRHPARVVPIIGSIHPERIRAAVRATEIEMTREEWYRLFVAARGQPLP